MSERLQLFIVLISLLSGSAAVFLSNRVMRKYPLGYLSSYSFFLVFYFIFSVYSILSSQVIERFLTQQQSDPEVIHSAESILIGLGIPFLILAWYMYLRTCREMFRKKLSDLFVAIYFIFFALSFVLYAIMNRGIGGMEALEYFMEDTQLFWTFSILTLVVFGAGIVQVFTGLSDVKDINQRKAFTWFAGWYAIITLLSIITLYFSDHHILFGLGFVLMIAGAHIVPVLFLHIYLQRYYVASVEVGSFSEKMERLVGQYEISKREAEVVELICKGMTNKEISDSLFISVQTVKDHIHRIFIKTGVKNRVQLTNLLEQ